MSIKEVKQLFDKLLESGRIEQIYLTVDYIVKLLKKDNTETYCQDCPLVCCKNDTFLPLTFLEWQTIETYLNTKVANETKKKIAENLENLGSEQFQEISIARQIVYKYKESLCPFLIDNKCSVFPYRPLQCRTYGYFSLDNQKGFVDACSLEQNRPKKKYSEYPELYKIQEPLIYLNLEQPVKLLIVWLKDYFTK